MKDKKEMVRNATLNILKHDFLYYVAVGKTFRGKMHASKSTPCGARICLSFLLLLASLVFEIFHTFGAESQYPFNIAFNLTDRCFRSIAQNGTV